jgi:hypothetical protein
LRVLHGTDDEILADAILNHENLLFYIAKFYGLENLDWEDKQRLLSAGNILLGKWFREYGPQHLERACQIYKFLYEKAKMAIDKRYMQIVETRDRCCINGPVHSVLGDTILCKWTEMKIQRIIRRMAKKFDIKII